MHVFCTPRATFMWHIIICDAVPNRVKYIVARAELDVSCCSVDAVYGTCIHMCGKVAHTPYFLLIPYLVK